MFCRSDSSVGGDGCTMSGSVASIHQASTPLLKSALLTWSQNIVRAGALNAS